MFRAFIDSLPMFEAMRIREENAGRYIEGLVHETEKLHMQIKLMARRIRDQRNHLRLGAERENDQAAAIASLEAELHQWAVECAELERELADLTRKRAATKKKVAKKAKR